VPKRASDRRLLTTTKPAIQALEEDLALVRQAVKARGTDFWHVRLLDFEGDPTDFSRYALQLAPVKRAQGRGRPDPQPYIAVDFVIGTHPGGELFVHSWSISGFEVLTTRQSRFPMQTYARAALFAVEDALDAGERTYKEYRVVDGQVQDPRTGKPRPRSRRQYVSAKSEELQTRVERAAEEYRRAVDRGSVSPTVDVAHALSVGRSTAARAIAAARKQGLLGPALRNRAGEQLPDT
jgi:hypothetical protein